MDLSFFLKSDLTVYTVDEGGCITGKIKKYFNIIRKYVQKRQHSLNTLQQQKQQIVYSSDGD